MYNWTQSFKFFAGINKDMKYLNIWSKGTIVFVVFLNVKT